MAAETAEKIQNIIKRADEELKSVTVEKPFELDIGNLSASALYTLSLGPEDINDDLKSIARDGVQSLLSKIWELPSRNEDGMIFATLPPGTTRIPREKPVPKAKKLTKWETYAKEKGFNQRKKTKKTWDDTLQKWVPRFGYRKVQAEKEKNWVKEVPGNADPYEDQFEKAAKVKKESIAKNEYKRLKNIARAQKIKVPSVGTTGNKFASSKDLGKALHESHHATASLGKFQPRLPNEKAMKFKGLGKKRKFEGNLDGEKEKSRNLEIAKKIRGPELNLSSAIDKQIRDENYMRSNTKKEKPSRRSKAGVRKPGKSEQKALVKGHGKVNRGIGAGKKGGQARKGVPKGATVGNSKKRKY